MQLAALPLSRHMFRGLRHLTVIYTTISVTVIVLKCFVLRGERG